jgi:hypothetical protein
VTGAELVSRASIVRVWAALGGGDLRAGRGRAFWRDGNGFNIALDEAKGCWHDFARGEGGGIVDLIVTALACSRLEALRWLAETEGVTLDGDTPTGRRKAARRHQTAAGIAGEVEAWRVAYMAELERRKSDALREENWEGLEVVSGRLNRIQNGGTEVVLAEYARMRQAEPRRLAQLIADGEERWAHAGHMAALVVALLARAEEEVLSAAA